MVNEVCDFGSLQNGNEMKELDFTAIPSRLHSSLEKILSLFFVGDRPEVPANVYSKIYIIRIIYSKSKLTQD